MRGGALLVVFDFHPLHITQSVCAAVIKMWAPSRCFLWNGSRSSWQQIECISLRYIQIELVTHYYELWWPGAGLKWDTVITPPQFSSQPAVNRSIPIWILPDLTETWLRPDCHQCSLVYNVITPQSDVHVQLQQMGGDSVIVLGPPLFWGTAIVPADQSDLYRPCSVP